jgi:26S proteasome regulatory subunit N5
MLNEQLSKDIDLIRFLEEEKRARLENEVIKSAQLCVKIVEYVYQKTRNINDLIFMLGSLNKKRNQNKNSIKEMVNSTLNNIYVNLNQNDKILLLKTIIEITEGRIYVEVNLFIKK